MRPPIRLIEPSRRGVSIATRGVAARTCARGATLASPATDGAAAGAPGVAAGALAAGAVLAGGVGAGAGKNRSPKYWKPIRIAIEIAIAMTRLRWSMSATRWRHRVDARSAPRVTTRDALQREPRAMRRAMDVHGFRRVMRAARPITAIGAKHRRDQQLIGADQHLKHDAHDAPPPSAR